MSPLWGGMLRDDAKNGCVGEETSLRLEVGMITLEERKPIVNLNNVILDQANKPFKRKKRFNTFHSSVMTNNEVFYSFAYDQ